MKDMTAQAFLLTKLRGLFISVSNHTAVYAFRIWNKLLELLLSDYSVSVAQYTITCLKIVAIRNKWIDLRAMNLASFSENYRVTVLWCIEFGKEMTHLYFSLWLQSSLNSDINFWDFFLNHWGTFPFYSSPVCILFQDQHTLVLKSRDEFALKVLLPSTEAERAYQLYPCKPKICT